MKKLTVFTEPKLMVEGTYRLKQLNAACKKLQVEYHKPTITNIESFIKKLPSFGPVVYPQTRPMPKLERDIATKLIIDSGRYLVNKNRYINTNIGNKFFQQITLREKNICKTIPSYYCSTKEKVDSLLQTDKLTYPFIVKKTDGTQGKQIHLIKQKKDLKKIDFPIIKWIIQPFIKNDGDYRVWVLNGKSLGVMKRVAKPGDHRNNVSQGGTATHVTDPKITTTIEQMAVSITNYFGLDVAGVDIILDQETNTYRFLEINTQPDWKGFQKVTGIHVAEKIVEFTKTKM